MHILKISYILAALSMSCNPNIDNSENIANATSRTEIDSLCVRQKSLIESVLNDSNVIRFSRLHKVRKAFDRVSISFSDMANDCERSQYYQRTDTLLLIDLTDSISTIETPVYEIKEIAIVGDSAYIHLEFDVTGAIAYGSLKELNGEWTPDSTFVIGVR